MWLGLFVVVAVGFGLGAWLGAPYLPTLRRQTDELLQLAELKPGQTLLDLGCGDGRLLKAAARLGVSGIGYEINPWLYLIARLNCYRYRRQVTIRLANFWRVKLLPADVIYVFLIGRYMPRLAAKLTADIGQPTRVISFVFAIPDITPVITTKNSYVYLYPNSAH